MWTRRMRTRFGPAEGETMSLLAGDAGREVGRLHIDVDRSRQVSGCELLRGADVEQHGARQPRGRGEGAGIQ